MCGGRKVAAGQRLCVWSFAIFTAATHLDPIFEPVIEQAGFKLVRLRIMGGQTKTLQIMAEREDGSMDVEGCSQLSHALLDFIETQDPIEGDYEIEVSSPGIDRPLTRRQDYERFAGFEAKLETARPLDGRKRFRGKVLGVGPEDQVRLMVETGEVFIPLAEVKTARLVLTDELIAAAMKEQEH